MRSKYLGSLLFTRLHTGHTLPAMWLFLGLLLSDFFLVMAAFCEYLDTGGKRATTKKESEWY